MSENKGTTLDKSLMKSSFTKRVKKLAIDWDLTYPAAIIRLAEIGLQQAENGRVEK